MIKRKTVLILGAGASRPYLFPVASELRQLLLEENEPTELLSNMGFQNNPLGEYHSWLETTLDQRHVVEVQKKSLQTRFKLSEIFSIDAFLAYNPGFDSLGRMMIAAILLRCENVRTLRGGWYQALFNEIVANGPDFPDGILSVITFNYDRSLELYLCRSLMFAFHLEEEEAWKMVARIKIVHVYGDLGPVRGDVPYGDYEAMGRAAQAIRLVRPHGKSEKIEEIKTVLEPPATLIFLGFGFDPLNLDAIGIIRNPDYSIHASCLALSRSRIKQTQDRLGDMYWGASNQDVSDFLHNHSLFS